VPTTNCSNDNDSSQRRANASNYSSDATWEVQVNFSDCADFLDSGDFQDDNVNQLEKGDCVTGILIPRYCDCRYLSSHLKKTLDALDACRIRQGSRMNHFAITSALLLSASSLIGCASLEVPYEPLGHAGGFDPVFGSCHTCGVCGGDCEGHTPASYIGHKLRCTSGCGEIYWGPWHSDPPDQCDPCDDCGDWVGDHYCEPKLRERIKTALTAYDGPPKHDNGCKSCGGKGGVKSSSKGCSSCGISPSEGDIYYESDEPTVAPNEAPTPELLPVSPMPPTPEPVTPTSIHPFQGVSLRLPFKIRSTRLSQ
jgi:hypothetical protein